MPDDRVAAVRAFNRFYTARIGVLRDGLLRTPHSLTEARVLYELGQREVTEVADLRRELDIDAGFLSRLLARLQRDGLVARERSTDDARRQRIRLTEEGAAAFAELDRRSADEIGAVLDALPEDDQQRLVAAMDTVHDVLTQAPPAAGFVLRAPAPRRPRLDRPAPRRALRAAVRLGRELRGARRADRGRLRRATTTRAARRRGSPRSTASPPAACCACAARTTSPSCACCSSTRGRAGAGSARG